MNKNNTFYSKQTLVLLALVFLGFLGVALPYPILTPLLLESGTNQMSDHLLLGVVLAVYPIGQFFGAPVLGSLSDNFGRKKLLLYSTTGTMMGYLFCALAIHLDWMALLIISRFLTGVFEGNIGIAQACINDLGVNKAKGLGAISACSSLGYLFGPLIGGLLTDQNLVSWFNYAIPFLAAAGFAFTLIIILILFFDEPNQNKNSKAISIVHHFNFAKKISRVSENPAVLSTMLFILVLCLSIDCYYEFYPAFLVKNWNATAVHLAYYTVVLSLALSIGAYLLPQWLNKYFKVQSYTKTLLLLYVLSLLALLFASSTLQLIVHFVFTGLFYGAINTTQMVILSNQASDDVQGEVMGLQWGFRMLGDGLLCILGALTLTLSSAIPIIIACLIGALGIGYQRKWVKVTSLKFQNE